MAYNTTLKDLSNRFATKQPEQVDWLTEETPILDVVPFEEASHTLWNVYDEVSDISGGGFVDMDAPLDTIKVGTRLKKVDLSILGAKMFLPEDKARAFGGRDAYFGKKQPKAMRKLGVDAEKALIYDNFRKYAVGTGRLLDAGAPGDGCYSILAVRFVPGETVGLYSKATFRQGGILDIKSVNGGGLYENEDGVLGYGVRIKGYFGIQIANPETVAAIVNVTSDAKPTAMQVDNLLDMVRGGENTYLFCHRKMMSVLADVGKGAAFQMAGGDKNVDRRIAEWNGVPIVTSYNFADGAEASVSVA